MGKFSPSNTSTPDLEVDDGTLSVDETNNRVGIGVTDPDHKLEVAGPIHISGETTTPSQPAGGDGGVLYVKADGKPYWRSNEISETDLTATGGGGGSTAADDISAGDAAINLKTSSGAINLGHADNDEAINIGSTGTGAIQIGHSTTTSVGVATTALTVASDTTTFTSANADDPLVQLKNTTNDASGARLQFVKDKGAAGADGDDIGVIEFVGDDAAQTQTTFAKIVAEVSEADDTDEAGKLSFFVAESDGTTTALAAGLVLEGEHATNGQVDVTIGAGAGSTTTIVGDARLNHDAAQLKFGVDSDVAIAHLHNTGLQIACNSANAPQLVLKGTSNDANGPILTFTKDKGSAGADSDDIGTIQFVGDDAAQTQTTFAKIVAEVSEADDTDEAGKLSFFVAESDGTTTTLTAGLVLEGEHATDGEIDVTIGAGAASTTTIVGDMSLNHDGAMISLGADSEINLTHVHDSGLMLTRTATGDGSTTTLTLATMEGAIEADDVIGKLAFQPIGETGTDAITVAAAIQATAEAAFDADENATKMEFMLGVSGAAATKMTLSSAGVVTATGGFTVGTNVITDDSIVMTPSTDDTVTIAAATNGALNITTVDNAAHGADLTLTVDGDTIMLAEGKPVARAVGTATASTTNIANAFSFIRPVIKVTADTQLYAGDSGALILFNDAAATLTLPDSGTAANLGVWFTIAVSNASAGTKKIIVTDTTNERFAGLIKLIDSDSSNAISFKPAAGAANVSITFNGSTTGTSGSTVTIIATAADEWTVIDSEVLVTGDPSSVSPFGTS